MCAVLFGFAAVLSAACGGGTAGPAPPPPPPPPPPNRAPTAVGALPSVQVEVGGTASVDVSGAFSDPDGDALTYTAASSNVGVATVSVSGASVTVTAAAKGSATVTVTATDGGGLSAQQSFGVTVPNRAPAAVGTLPVVELAIGETEAVDVSGAFADPDGDALTFAVASSNDAVAAGAASGSVVTVTGVGQGSSTLTVTASDPDGLSARQAFEVSVINRAPATVGTLPGIEVAVGESRTVEVSGAFSDPDGDALTYAASSTDVAVATASTTGSVVTVTAASQGRAVVTVTATDGGGLSAEQSFAVTVPNRAPAAVGTLPGLDLIVGESRTVDISRAFSDPDGDALSHTATSSKAGVASVTVSGTVVTVAAVGAGDAVVTAVATDGGGLSATQTLAVSVREPVPVRITGVQPPVLVEGESATIHGQGFASVPGENEVLIGGLAATVTAASATSLVIDVPYADCLPPRTVQLSVTAFGRNDAAAVGVTPAREEDLALPAGWYLYTYAGNGCLHLPRSATGAEYLIGVVSTSEVPSSLTPVTMTGTPGDPTVAAEGSGVVAHLLAASQAFAPADLGGTGVPRFDAAGRGVPADLDQEALGPPRDRRRHDEIMERNRSLARRLGPPEWPARTVDALADTVNYARGDTVTLYADPNRTCRQSTQVRAVVRLVGDTGIWLDDIANPSGTFTDAELSGLDAFLTRHTAPVLDGYFGALSDVDGNGRILVLMTQEVNRVENAGGWVSWADLYPVSDCATSNEAEITYVQVPDPAGIVGQATTKQSLLDFYPQLLTHEVTHLVQANAQVLGSADFKTSWEVEGGASLAQQLVAYRLFGHGSNRDLDYDEYQAGGNWYLHAWVADMAYFFGWGGSGGDRTVGAPEECTWIGRASEGNDGPCLGNAVYGVPSMVLRSAMDRWGGDYPGGEQALMKRLTQSPQVGFASLEDVGGEPIEGILANFYMSLWTDGRVWNSVGMTSWNLYDIFSNFVESARLLPWTSSHAAFKGSWNVRAGSSFYLHWTPGGGMAPTSLKVTSSNGAPAPGHVSVWALRIR